MYFEKIKEEEFNELIGPNSYWRVNRKFEEAVNLFLIKEPGKNIGYFECTEYEDYGAKTINIDNFYIFPNYRNQGYGHIAATKLLEKLTAKCQGVTLEVRDHESECFWLDVIQNQKYFPYIECPHGNFIRISKTKFLESYRKISDLLN